MRLVVDERTELRLLEMSDAEALYAAVDRERERLAKRLPWAPTASLDGTFHFISDSRGRWERGEGLDLGIWQGGEFVGVVGFSTIDPFDLTATMGYWLAARVEGRGLMTRACARLLDHAFGPMGLHRVEIRVAPDNERSLAVARRLGAREEGRAREAALLRGERLDLLVFGVLAPEWHGRGI